MTNNDIFKKLRVALQLRDDQIVEILELVDFRISKGEIGNFFRTADHPKYMECGDQVLRNFLNGLVIYLRGTKENPKKPMDVLEQNKTSINKTSKKAQADRPKSFSDKPKVKSNSSTKTTSSKLKNSKKSDNAQNPFAGIKFNNGKKREN